jgi:hypothetical protein
MFQLLKVQFPQLGWWQLVPRILGQRIFPVDGFYERWSL